MIFSYWVKSLKPILTNIVGSHCCSAPRLCWIVRMFVSMKDTYITYLCPCFFAESAWDAEEGMGCWRVTFQRAGLWPIYVWHPTECRAVLTCHKTSAKHELKHLHLKSSWQQRQHLLTPLKCWNDGSLSLIKEAANFANLLRLVGREYFRILTGMSH